MTVWVAGALVVMQIVHCTYKAMWMALGDVQKVFYIVRAHTPGIRFSDDSFMVCNIYPAGK